jgi:hypothetical protein
VVELEPKQKDRVVESERYLNFDKNVWDKLGPKIPRGEVHDWFVTLDEKFKAILIINEAPDNDDVNDNVIVTLNQELVEIITTGTEDPLEMMTSG